jgi:phage terminase small subunit
MNAFDPVVPFTIVRQGSAPEPPPTLDDVASTLWRSILTQRRFTNTAELAILENACQAYSRAEGLRRIIAIEGETVTTETGFKANPLMMVELQARALCTRLLDRLIPAEDKRGRGRPSNEKLSF